MCGICDIARMNQASIERVLAENLAGRIDHGKRLYALVVLALWGNKS